MRTGRNNDRTGSYAFAAVELKFEQAVRSVTLQIFHFGGNCNVGSELLCLNEGASGQGLSRDPSWKAKVILNSGAGAGLTAKCPSVENRNRQPFGR